MNTTRASARSVLLPTFLLLLALAAAATTGSGVWLVIAAAVASYLALKLLFPPRPVNDSRLASRVEFLERRVAALDKLVQELRVERVAARTPPRPAPRSPELGARVRPQPSPRLPVAEPVAEPPRATKEFDWRRTLAAADLMGAKALAIAGGIVTLLGVVFFFVLAVNRGWIGPGMRIAFGGIASMTVFGAGLWVKQRYETTYSALVAVGTGIAGAYMTLLAAVSLYDLVPKPVALVIAGVIASVAVGVSLLWEEELVAGFGLIGGMIVPATLFFQGGVEEIGTAFVALVFAGTTVVAVRERWWKMLQVGAVVSVPQALVQFADADAPSLGIVALATVFWLLYVAAALAFHFRVGPALTGAPTSFLMGSALFAGVSAELLYGDRGDDVQQGVVLLVVAAVYAVAAVVLHTRGREPATLLWMLALAVGAVGLAEAMTGSALTYAWAAEAAVLAWLAGRVGDGRFRIASLVYLALALGHAALFEASPDHLFELFRHPAKGAPAALAVAVASLVFALTPTPTEEMPTKGILRVLDPVLLWLRSHVARIKITLFSLAAVITAYALSLGILELFQAVWPGEGIATPFEWGHVAIVGTWSLGGLIAVIVAARARSGPALAIALGWLAVTVLKVVGFDAMTLEETRFGISLLIAGAAVLVGGLARELVAEAELTAEGAGAVLTGLGLLVWGSLVLVPAEPMGIDGDGLVLAGAGALYVSLASAAFVLGNKRDLSTLLWSLGLLTAAIGAELLLGGVWLVLAYSFVAAALACVSMAASERRLQLGSLVYLILAAVHTLLQEAPPSDLVTKGLHPGNGVPSLLLVIGATAVLAWALGRHGRYRLQAIWTAGALGVYAASLAILEAAQQLSHQGVQMDFQRGHTVVSAFWGLLALASLYVGLRKRTALLRGGGFGLFAISLGKIFLFDLPSLSSVQRALSFLAVGAVLLLGGFFYQRLSAQFDDRPAV